MDHEPVLISTIAIGLTAAFIGGFVARRLGLPTIVGYIAAGVVIGPFTPGLVADPAIATELAEVGVILLMFGVGIQFSFRELLAVRWIAIPGALIQTVVATALGVWLGPALGWGMGGGLVLGLALSIASTVVLLRALADRNEEDTTQGHIAVGWLIVEDLLAVLVLVLLPALAPALGGTAGAGGAPPDPAVEVALALGKAAVFAILMAVAGARIVPWLMLAVARQGSRELFSLAVLAIALGIAYVSSSVFGVSFALGAFLAGAGRRPIGHEPPGRGRCPAPARRLRRALLRVGRACCSIPPTCWPTRWPSSPYLPRDRREGDHEVRHRRRSRLSTAGRPDRGGGLGADRRVLVHRRDDGPQPRAAARGRLPAHRRRCPAVDRHQPVPVPAHPTPGAQSPGHPRHQGPHGAAGRRARPPAVRGTGGPPATRHHLRLWPRRTAHRARAGATRLPVRGHHPATGRGGPLCARGESPRSTATRPIPTCWRWPRSTPRGWSWWRPRSRTRRGSSSNGVRERNDNVDIVVRTHNDIEAAQLRSLGAKVQVVHGERELAVQMARYALRRFGVSATEAEAIAQGLRGRAVAPATSRPGYASGLLERLRQRISGRRA